MFVRWFEVLDLIHSVTDGLSLNRTMLLVSYVFLSVLLKDHVIIGK